MSNFFIARNGMSVSINSYNNTNFGNGYTRYDISYTEKNLSSSSIDQATLRLFFQNGEPEAQYGFFGRILPGESFAVTSSYSFTAKSDLIPSYLEYDADHFFAKEPIKDALFWSINGNQLTLFVINKEPAGSDTSITILEDSSYTFSVKDFGFSDTDGNSLSSVKIKTIPTSGSLKFNGTLITNELVSSGYEVKYSDIISGKLVFTPSDNSNINSQFYFQVRDNGGIANGGIDIDQSANIVTFRITAVNDDPILENPITDQIANEDTTFTFVVPENTFIDADTGDSFKLSTALVNANGELVGTGSLPSWLSFKSFNKTLTGTPENSDVGNINIKVIATDNANLSVSDQFNLKISNTNDNPSGSVSISGTALVRQILTVSNTLTDADGIGNITYQWLRTGQVISGATTNNYEISSLDIGQTLSVTASFKDGFGTQESVLSSSGLTILPQATVNSELVNQKETLVGTVGSDVFDGTKTPSVLLSGGQGDDDYLINNSTTKVKEAAKQGVDIVFSSVSYTLPNNVEVLKLTDNGNINANGNKLDNLLVGNNGNNILSGYAGNDTLTGLGGSDRFMFESIPNNKNNIDTITDFISGVDIIVLNTKFFKALGPQIGISNFLTKNSANLQTKTGVLTYDALTGELAYDSDGIGKKAAIQIALIGVSEHPELQSSDFIIV